MSDTHEANVVRVGEILPHPNADKLEITHVGGYQVVVGKGNFKTGDLAVYIQPDSVVPQTEPFRFIWADHVGVDGVVPAKRRRITVKRLRKEYSEGLLMPVSEVLPVNDRCTGWDYPEGQDVAATIGIEHYVPEETANTVADSIRGPRRKYPRSLRGWFFFLLRKLGLRGAGGKSYAQEVSFHLPVYHVHAYKNRPHEIPLGSDVSITEKIHGSNARYVVIDDTFYAGSHEQWKKDGVNVWWNVARQYPEIEQWCFQNPGLVLYGEVGPTQKGYPYGTENGEVFFFAFDVYDPKENAWYWPGNVGFAGTVPILYMGKLDKAAILYCVDGPSVVPGAKTLREGIVIRDRNRTGRKLKVVSNVFYEQEGKNGQ